MGKKLGVFHLGTPKSTFLMRKISMDTRNLGIYPNKQGRSFQSSKKEQSWPPLPAWPVSQERQIL